MNNIRFHAKHIVIEQNSNVALRQANSKLIGLTDNKERFTFVKLIHYYATRQKSDLEQLKQHFELELVNPDSPHKPTKTKKKKWKLQVKAYEIEIRNYNNLLEWCSDQFDFISKELLLIDRLGEDWKKTLGPEFIQLPKEFKMTKLRKKHGIDVSNTRRESAVLLYLLTRENMILPFETSSLSRIGEVLTGYSAEKLRQEFSSLEGVGKRPKDVTLNVELKSFEKVRYHLNACIDYINIRLKAIQEEQNSEERDSKNPNTDSNKYL